MIEVSLNFGKTLLNNKQHQKAYAVFTECLKISQSTGHPTSIAASLGCLGMFFMSNDVARGISYYGNALEVLKNFDNKEATSEGRKLKVDSKIRRRNLQIMADACGSIGSGNKEMRNFTESIKYFQKYLEACEELGDVHGKAIAHGNIGASYRNLGQIYQAMQCFEKELRIAEASEDTSLQFHAHTNLGLCYRDVGEYHKALHCHEASLAVAIATGCKEDEGGAYANLSNVYRYLRDTNKALEYSKKSLKLAKELGDLRGQFIASGGLGNAYCTLGDFKTSSDYFRENANLARKIGDKKLIARAEHSLGLAYFFREDYMEAFAHHKTAHSLFKEAGMRLPAYHAMLGTAKCLRMSKEYKAAIGIYQECIKEYEEVRAHLGNQENLKVSIGDLHVIVYKALAYSMVQADQVRDAVLAEDRGRAMALKDLLYHKFAVKSEYAGIKELCPKDADRVSKFVDKLQEDAGLTVVFYSFFNGQMFIWVVSSSRGVQCVRPWGENDPQRFWTLFELVNKSLAEIRQGVREHGTVEDRVISVSETGGPEDIFVVQESMSLPWNSEKEVASSKGAQPQPTRKGVPASSARKPVDVSDSKSTLRKLYDILIKPVEHLIEGSRLLIIPEVALYRLPFSALRDDEGIFLSKKFSIQVCTSLEILAIISERPKQKLQGGALVIGNPLVGRVLRRGEEVTPCGLPGAQREAEHVASYLNTTPLVQEMATKSRVLKHLVKASIIHIAAHGDPRKGEIVLVPDPDPSQKNRLSTEEKYMLTCADIASLSLRARLVVLSCCQTAQGDIRAEGVVGIARSFLGAGASAVVVTLWAIDDDATLSFMELFYNHVIKNLSVCQALQKSMVTMQGRDEFKRISNWAPFYIVGEDVKFSDEEIQRMKDSADSHSM